MLTSTRMVKKRFTFCLLLGDVCEPYGKSSAFLLSVGRCNYYNFIQA
jgi:hypothetical protein